MDNHKKTYNRMTNRKTGYPIATIAYYGPDDQKATKVVVGILTSDKIKVATEIKRWFSEDQDIRLDPKIFAEMIDYISDQNVHRIATMDRIIGCPHEEKIDYPEGGWCPQCPFWMNRDRWTGELLE